MFPSHIASLHTLKRSLLDNVNLAFQFADFGRIYPVIPSIYLGISHLAQRITYPFVLKPSADLN